MLSFILGAGCRYPPLGSEVYANECCYMNCDKCMLVQCPVASNDCHLAGSCQVSGLCSDETMRPDGSPCNSQPQGVCRNGVCVISSTLTIVPSMLPKTTIKSSAYPSKKPISK